MKQNYENPAAPRTHTSTKHAPHRTSSSGPTDAPFSSRSRPTRSREVLHVTKAAVALHSPPPTSRAPLPSPTPAARTTTMKAGPGGAQRPESSPPARLASDKIPAGKAAPRPKGKDVG